MKHQWLISGLVVAILALGIWYLLPCATTRTMHAPAPVSDSNTYPDAAAPASQSGADTPTATTGKNAPASTRRSPVTTNSASAAAHPPRLPLEDGGHSQAVQGDRNAQTAAIRETLLTGKHPERVSALLPPKPFDRAAFEADPAPYLNLVEPGRVFQAAQPAKDVPELSTQSPAMTRIARNGEVSLTVKGAPLAPVSFTSFDMGTFKENRLNCITVRADKTGVASVTFVGSAGAINDCNILAGSPMASGQVRFTVTIEVEPVIVGQK